jgi:hypothetical protein
MSKLSRRALLSSASLAAIAALPSLEVLAAIPGVIPSRTSSQALSELAEVRRLIATLVAIDDQISPAETADDAKRVDDLEAAHVRAYRRLRQLQNGIEEVPPQCWVDVVTRAELVGYEFLHGKSRAEWDSLVAVLDDEHCEFARESRPCLGRSMAR